MTPDHWTTLAGLAAYAGLEWFLGKTKRIKANSLIEWSLSLGRSAITLAFRKRF